MEKYFDNDELNAILTSLYITLHMIHNPSKENDFFRISEDEYIAMEFCRDKILKLMEEEIQ